MRSLFIIASMLVSMISQAAPCRLKGEAFCLNGSQYGFVASNACVDYGGHIIIAKKIRSVLAGKKMGSYQMKTFFGSHHF